jgi:hypothetical protein
MQDAWTQPEINNRSKIRKEADHIRREEKTEVTGVKIIPGGERRGERGERETEKREERE